MYRKCFQLYSFPFFSDTTGERTIQVNVPDTITTWYANGFALSPSDGIGLATPASVKAFKPFFISLSLPYSVIRGETMKIPALVYNYLDDCLIVSPKNGQIILPYSLLIKKYLRISCFTKSNMLVINCERVLVIFSSFFAAYFRDFARNYSCFRNPLL